MKVCFFPHCSQLVAGTIFRFVHIDLSDQCSRSVVKAPNFDRSAFTEMKLHVTGSV